MTTSTQAAPWTVRDRPRKRAVCPGCLGYASSEVNVGLFRWLLHGWRRLEHALSRVGRFLRPWRREVESRVTELGRELWDWVDDLPFVSELAPMTPVKNQLYGHGSFMGAAPALLDPRWRRILRLPHA